MNHHPARKRDFRHLHRHGAKLLAIAGCVGAASGLVAQAAAPMPAAAASAPAQQGGTDLPPPIQAMLRTGNGVRFLDKFDAGSGLTGYVMAAGNGERRIFYVTPDRKTAILGLMFDDRLANVTAEHQRTFMDVSEFVSPAKKNGYVDTVADMATRAAPLAMAVEGRGMDVFVFVDPTAGDFGQLLRASRAGLASLRLHWMATSPGPDKTSAVAAAAAGILGAGGTEQALSALAAAGKAGAAADEVARKRASQLLLATEAVTRQAGVRPPFVAYFDAANVPRLITGLPTPAQWQQLASDGNKIVQAQRARAAAAAASPASEVSR